MLALCIKKVDGGTPEFGKVYNVRGGKIMDYYFVNDGAGYHVPKKYFIVIKETNLVNIVANLICESME